MKKITGAGVSRRHLLEATGSATLAGVASSLVPRQHARAARRTLRILKWSHAIAAYDEWFVETFARQWGQNNDTTVLVDRVGFGEVDSRARAEADQRRGHDLVIFLNPGARHEDRVIDLREVYGECEQRYGKAFDFATRSTYNPKTKKYFAISLGYQPTVITYRKDLWDSVGTAPDSWANILAGGRQIRLRNDKPVGFSLAPEHNSEHTMRAIMYGFGASEQDENGNPALKSRSALEAIKYVKALYDETMFQHVLTWDVVSNDQFMLNGDGCLTLDTVNILRVSESTKLPTANDLRLAGMPEGPAGRRGPAWGLVTAMIWNFAENIEGAQQFLIDYIGSSQQALLTSGFQSMPSWPGAVPELESIVAEDPGEGTPGKYAVLAESAGWTTNVGYPGHTSAAVGEIFDRGLIPTMFARAVTGELLPEEALDQTDRKVRVIFQKWKQGGKI